LSWIFKQINDNFILIPTIVEMHALEKVNELFIIKWIEEKIVDCHISFVNNLCGRCLYIGWLLGFWCWYIFMPNLIDLWSINVCVLLIMCMCMHNACFVFRFYSRMLGMRSCPNTTCVTNHMIKERKIHVKEKVSLISWYSIIFEMFYI
jgi:hypothetical protein